MAITYPLIPPDAFKAAKLTIRQNSVVGESTSPFTAEQQHYVHPAQWLEAEIVLPSLRHDVAEEVIAFIWSLRGKEGTFLMGDCSRPGLMGVGGGTPVVDGASQTGLVLNIRGLPISTANVFKAGDWIQLGSGNTSRLHKVLTSVSSDGTGKASVDIWPRLRYSPADGAAIVTSSPVGIWRLSINDFGYDLVPGVFVQGLTLPLREAL